MVRSCSIPTKMIHECVSLTGSTTWPFACNMIHLSTWQALSRFECTRAHRRLIGPLEVCRHFAGDGRVASLFPIPCPCPRDCLRRNSLSTPKSFRSSGNASDTWTRSPGEDSIQPLERILVLCSFELTIAWCPCFSARRSSSGKKRSPCLS